MHRITTPKNPIVVETAVSGVSTPSSIGQVNNDGEVVPGFLVEWVNPTGHERFCGKASGGISAESVVHLISALTRTGRASTFTVSRIR